MEVNVGIGSNCNDFKHLYSSYKDALKALDCKYALGNGGIYYIHDLSYVESEFYYPVEVYNKLISAVKANNKLEITKSLESLKLHLVNKNTLSPANIKVILIDFVTSLAKLLVEIKDPSKNLWNKSLEIYSAIDSIVSPNEIIKIIQPLAFDIASNISSLRESNSKSLVSLAMSYIQENYNDEFLSLGTVSEAISVSSGYLSALFKKEKDINFKAYITNIRMSKAIMLLSTTDMSVSEIAYNVGYSNPHYFSISFKKHNNMTPSDYRLNLKDY